MVFLTHRSGGVALLSGSPQSEGGTLGPAFPAPPHFILATLGSRLRPSLGSLALWLPLPTVNLTGQTFILEATFELLLMQCPSPRGRPVLSIPS